MNIIGIVANNQNLIVEGRENSTSYFRAFMNYCIDHYEERIRSSKLLKFYFKFDSQDPSFGRDIEYKTITEHNRIFYSTHWGTKQKIDYIENIADIINIPIEIITD